jgi:hypothetical protein
LKECEPVEDGTITVTVVPVADGFNSPAPATYEYNKTRLAAPRNLAIDGREITWKAVNGATSYEILFGEDDKYTVEAEDGTTFTIPSAVNFANGISIKIRAINAEKNSLWSNPIVAEAEMSEITYNDHRVSWGSIVGASGYQVRLNGGNPVSIASNVTSYEVTFTQAGENFIYVRFQRENNEYSDWVSTTVEVYTLSFDAQGGTPVDSALYAYGDSMTKPTTTKANYNFVDWFTAPDAGDRFAFSTPYDFEQDVTVYAHWSAEHNAVSLDYNDRPAPVSAPSSVNLVYGNSYELPVPANRTDVDGYIFMGWYGEVADEDGVVSTVRYTGANGRSLRVWDRSATSLYANWSIDHLLFLVPTDGTDGFEVMANRSIMTSEEITEVYIPATYEGKKVFRIRPYAFQNLISLEKAIITENISDIATESFSGSNNFKGFEFRSATGNDNVSYVILDGLPYRLMGDAENRDYDLVFWPAGRSGEIVLPDEITRIPANMFAANSRVTKISFPSTMVHIGATAFQNCANLTEVVFRKDASGNTSLESIAAKAFAGCTKLTSISIPNSLKDTGDKNYVEAGTDPFVPGLGNEAFGGCTNLTTVILEKGGKNPYSLGYMIATLDYGPFYGCRLLTAIEIPLNVTYVGQRTFNTARIANLTFEQADPNDTSYVEIPLTFEEDAFADILITSLIIPARTIFIGEYAFSVVGGTTSQMAPDSFSFEMGGTRELVIKQRAFQSLNINVESLVIPWRVSEIGDSAFWQEIKIGALTFEATPEGTNELPLTIATNAFDDANLTSVAIPARVTSIGTRAFSDSKSLTSATIEDGDRPLTLGTYIFDNSAITTLNMPSRYDPATFDVGVYNGMENLRMLNISTESKNFSSVLGVVYDKAKTTLLYYPAGLTDEDIREIPETVTKIGPYALSYNKNITSFVVPWHITRIQANAFYDTLSLASIVFEGGETLNEALIIEEKAFMSIDNLASVIFEANSNVTHIGMQAFQGSTTPASKLTSIQLPSTLIQIGQQAFQYTAITSLVIPGSVKAIGTHAFANMPRLASVEFGEGETLTLATNVFSSDPLLTQVTFPKQYGTQVASDLPNGSVMATSFAEIFQNASPDLSIAIDEDNTYYIASEGVIYQKDSATGAIKGSIVYIPGNMPSIFSIPEGVTNIAPKIFMNASWLQKVVLPSTLKTISEGAFMNCAYLTEVSFHQGITNLAFSTSVFSGCSALTSIALPDSLTSLPSYTFQDCSSLTSISLPSALTTIASRAFNRATSLKSITFNPKADGTFALTTIDTYAFEGCINLAEAFDGSAPAAPAEDETPVAPKKFFIPSTVTTIATNALKGTAIESIILPSGLSTLGGSVFENCTKLQSVTFAGSLIKILNGSLFANTTSLKTVEIPALVTTINGNCFEGSGITSITIPSSVNTIGTFAFRNCFSLKTVTFATGSTSTLTLTEGSALVPNTFGNCTALETVNLPARLATIPYDCFANCTSLVNVNFEQNEEGFNGTSKLTTIKNQAFVNCTSLTHFYMPNTVTTAGSTSPWKGCSSLIYMQVSAGMKNENAGAFVGFNNIEKFYVDENAYPTAPGNRFATLEDGSLIRRVYASNAYTDTLVRIPTGVTGDKVTGIYTIPYTVGNISPYAFSYASKIKGIYFEPTPEGVTETTLKIAAGASPSATADRQLFMGTNIKTINFPARLNTLGDYNFAFSKVEEVTFEPGTNIELLKGAFYGATSLKRVTLPDGLLKMDRNMFYHCYNLESVRVASADPSKQADYEIGTAVFPDSVTLFQDAFYALFDNKDYRSETVYGIFADCLKITKLVLPKNLAADFSPTAFVGAHNVEEISIANDAPNYAVVDGVLFTKDLKTLVMYPAGKKGEDGKVLTSYTIPTGTETIGHFAFDATGGYNFNKTAQHAPILGGNNVLKTITVPNTVTFIDIAAFKSTHALETVIFEKGGTEELVFADKRIYPTSTRSTAPTEIGLNTWGGWDGMFFDSAIKYIEIPARVKIIPRIMFAQSSLETLTFEENSQLEKIADGAFIDCFNLKNYVLPDNGNLTSIGKQAFQSTIGPRKLVIPDSVTFMDAFAFRYSYGIEEVDFSSAMTYVAPSTFQDCTNLKTVYGFGEGLDTFKDTAFSGCTNLGNTEGTTLPVFDIPSTVTTLERNMFQNCTSLKTITIPKAITVLDVNFFSGCTSLGNLELGNIERIGSNVFKNCVSMTVINLPALTMLSTGSGSPSTNMFEGTSIKSFTFGDKLTQIAPGSTSYSMQSAFLNCKELEEVTFNDKIPDNLWYTNYFNSGVFDGCEKLTTITNFPNTRKINTSMFRNCVSLSRIIPKGTTNNTVGHIALPASIDGIAGNAFQNCVSIKTIDLPAALTSSSALGANAFDGCTSLEAIEIPLVTGYTTLANFAFRNCTSLKTVTWRTYSGAAPMTAIGTNTFEGCTSLTNFVAPSTVSKITTIGVSAFKDCTALRTFTFPTATTTIKANAFDGTSNVTYTLPNTVKTVEANAFANTNGVTVNFGTGWTSVAAGVFANSHNLTVSIPSTVTSLAIGAFEGNTDLHATFASKFDYVAQDGILFSKDKSTLYLFPKNRTGSYTVPETVTTIADSAFASSALTEIVLSSKLETIGASAFANSLFTEISIPVSVTSIGASAFAGSANLATVLLNNVGVTPSLLETIGASAFENCPLITEIDIPLGVTSIGASAFAGTNLTTFTAASLDTIGASMLAGMTTLTTVNIGGKATDLPASIFAGCTALTSVTLPATINTIGASAFEGCSALESINLNNIVTSIGDSAFAGCVALTAMDLPEDLTSIGANAFNGCTMITTLDVPAGVSTFGAGAFANSGLVTITFNGPATSFGAGIFQNCTALIGGGIDPDDGSVLPLIIPDGVTKVEANAFDGCIALTGVVIPDGVTQIEAAAFRNCVSISYLQIPETLKLFGVAVTEMATDVFEGWTSSQIIYIDIESHLVFYSWSPIWTSFYDATIIFKAPPVVA